MLLPEGTPSPGRIASEDTRKSPAHQLAKAVKAVALRNERRTRGLCSCLKCNPWPNFQPNPLKEEITSITSRNQDGNIRCRRDGGWPLLLSLTSPLARSLASPTLSLPSFGRAKSTLIVIISKAVTPTSQCWVSLLSSEIKVRNYLESCHKTEVYDHTDLRRRRCPSMLQKQWLEEGPAGFCACRVFGINSRDKWKGSGTHLKGVCRRRLCWEDGPGMSVPTSEIHYEEEDISWHRIETGECARARILYSEFLPIHALLVE